MSELSVNVESFKPLRSNALFGFADILIPELHLRAGAERQGVQRRAAIRAGRWLGQVKLTVSEVRTLVKQKAA